MNECVSGQTDDRMNLWMHVWINDEGMDEWITGWRNIWLD